MSISFYFFSWCSSLDGNDAIISMLSHYTRHDLQVVVRVGTTRIDKSLAYPCAFSNVDDVYSEDDSDAVYLFIYFMMFLLMLMFMRS